MFKVRLNQDNFKTRHINFFPYYKSHLLINISIKRLPSYDYYRNTAYFNLSFDGVLKTPIFDGGLNRPPSIFICENNRKSNKIMPVLIFFWGGSFEDMGIFHVFQF